MLAYFSSFIWTPVVDSNTQVENNENPALGNSQKIDELEITKKKCNTLALTTVKPDGHFAKRAFEKFKSNEPVLEPFDSHKPAFTNYVEALKVAEKYPTSSNCNRVILAFDIFKSEKTSKVSRKNLSGKHTQAGDSSRLHGSVKHMNRPKTSRTTYHQPSKGR